ncbi:MAG: ATP-binding protein [Chloroflexota bacterium]
MVTSSTYDIDKTFLDYVDAMVDANSYEDLASRLVQKIRDLFNVELCTIWRRVKTAEHEQLVLYANVGIRLETGAAPPNYILDQTVKSNEDISGVTTWIAIRRQVCLANSMTELRDDPSKPWYGAHRGTWDRTQFPKEGEQFKCLLGLPIVYRSLSQNSDELIGVLKMESKQNPGGFTLADQSQAERLMPFIATALKTMEVREQHEQNRQQVIRSLTSALLKQQEPSFFYQQVVDQTADLLKADVCSLWLVDIDKKKLRLGANYGVAGKGSPPEYELNWEAKEDQEIKGLTPWVAIRKRSFWGERIEVLKANKAWQGIWDPQQWALKPFGCLYAVPLLDMNNNCFGVLKIENSFHKQKFDPVDRATFDLMADFISLAIELNSRLRSDVIYDFFHLLKQPVSNAVQAFEILTSELQLKEPRPERIKSRLDMMARNLQTVRVWILNVYGLAATRQDAPGTEASEVPLSTILTEAVDNMKALFPEDFVCAINCDASYSIQLTPLQRKKIDAVLFNILDNSFKYSSPPRDIRAEAKQIDTGYELVISDNGRGIAEEDLPRVFEPYFSRGADMWPASMGLGLSTVRRLLDERNWQYRIESKLGVGTCFTIRIEQEKST